MLYSANITNKKKERMIQRVTKKFGRARQEGISYESFRNFYNVLFGGADLERAMFFLDTEGRGVNREEVGAIIAIFVFHIFFYLVDIYRSCLIVILCSVLQDRAVGGRDGAGPTRGGRDLHAAGRGRG